MSLLLQVIIAFIKIGAFSFGGGYAVLAFIQQEVVNANGWLTPEEFVNVVAIAEMTPGPIAVNSSTFVGYNLFGVWGGILCSLCVLAVPFTLALIVAIYFTKFKDNKHLKNALTGIRPAVIGLIAASCLSVGRISITSWVSLIFFGVALLLVWKFKVNPIITLAICGVLGAGIYGYLIPMLG
ncbi:chromate transporter [Ruminococcaceae bacterium OttesenSCG-928-A11]|nr:chromate transporter [Ruminococcaceae bacterium OttesenSCG-928-A11]